MGTLNIEIEIGDSEGTRFEPVSALVDTGASYTTVPSPLLRRLDVAVHSQVTFVLADGRTIQRDIGQTWIRIDGHSIITIVVFGDERSESLLGAYTLQGLLLSVDTPNERLVPVPGLLM